MDEQDKRFFREMLDEFGRKLDEKLDARFEEQAGRFDSKLDEQAACFDEKLKARLEEQGVRFDKLQEQGARFEQKLEEQGARFDNLEEQVVRLERKIEEQEKEFEHKVGLHVEALRHDFRVYGEGHEGLVERVGRMEARLGGKIDRVIDALTAHRLDPEAHRGYRVSEPEGGAEK